MAYLNLWIGRAMWFLYPKGRMWVANYASASANSVAPVKKQVRCVRCGLLVPKNQSVVKVLAFGSGSAAAVRFYCRECR